MLAVLSRMRVRRLILALVLGAVANVAVAWGCAVWSWPLSGSADFQEVTGRFQTLWEKHAGSSGRAPTIESEITSFGLTGQSIGWHANNTAAYVTRTMVGCPCRSFQGVGVFSPATTATHTGGVVLSLGGRQVFLPYRPIWPGLLINTLIYAVPSWFLLAAGSIFFTRLQARLRARRDGCPTCGYPIGTSAVCTECGASIKAGAH